MRLLKSSRGKTVLALSVVAALCICVVLGSFIYDIGNPLGQNKTYIPSYPGAQQVQLLTGDQIPTPVSLTGPNNCYADGYDRMVTFVTADSAQRVLAFYKTAMAQRILEGWRLGYEGETAHCLSMESYEHQDMGTPAHTLNVDTEQVGTRTYVTVTRGVVPGF